MGEGFQIVKQCASQTCVIQQQKRFKYGYIHGRQKEPEVRDAEETEVRLWPVPGENGSSEKGSLP